MQCVPSSRKTYPCQHVCSTGSGQRLTFIVLTWRTGWALNNVSKWKMEFNLAFKGLRILYWENYVPYRLQLCFVAGIFLKLLTQCFPHMRYKLGDFRCDRSIFKGTLFTECSTLWALFWLLFKGTAWTIHTLQFQRMNCTNCMFGCDQSANKGAISTDQATLSPLFRLPFRFPWNLIFRTLHSL
jgi:hypothetical protein